MKKKMMWLIMSGFDYIMQTNTHLDDWTKLEQEWGRICDGVEDRNWARRNEGCMKYFRRCKPPTGLFEHGKRKAEKGSEYPMDLYLMCKRGQLLL